MCTPEGYYFIPCSVWDPGKKKVDDTNTRTRGDMGIRIRKSAAPYSFFFLKPKKRLDADRYAESLLQHKSVQEVIMVSGEYGFIVKSRHGRSKESAATFISRRNRHFRKMDCHYQYIKSKR